MRSDVNSELARRIEAEAAAIDIARVLAGLEPLPDDALRDLRQTYEPVEEPGRSNREPRADPAVGVLGVPTVFGGGDQENGSVRERTPGVKAATATNGRSEGSTGDTGRLRGSQWEG